MKPDSLWPKELQAGLEAMGLDLASDRQACLIDYLALLAKWNRAYNLTAVRDPRQAVARQLLDALSILPLIQGPRLIDLGTGPGLPGLPLAVARPDIEVVLLDSNAKKTRFLDQARLTLGLENIEVARARAEAYRPERPFDTITSRAFAALPEMVAVSRHLLAPGGRWVAMKGRRPDDELAALPADFHTRVVPLAVPGEPGARHAVVIEAGSNPSGVH